MPTITATLSPPTAAGPPAKGPLSLLVPGDPPAAFAALLATGSAEPAIGLSVRQPLAAAGMPLPPAVIASTPAGEPPIDVMASLPLDPAHILPPAEPAVPDPAKPIASLPAVPLPASRALPKDLPIERKAKQEGEPDGEGGETPAEVLAETPLPTAPIVALLTPQATLVPTPLRGAKSAALPSISTVRTPTASRPVVSAAIPQVARDIRWDGPAPTTQPLAEIPIVPAAPPVVVPLPLPPSTALPIATGIDPLVAPQPSAPVTDAQPDLVQSLSTTPAAPPIAATTSFAPAIVTGPALQVFGAAISAAVRRERGEEAASPIGNQGTIMSAAISAPLAAPIASSGEPMLDMRQDRWPQAMIAHIETLRDAADAGDTRIRLIPDALGTIDVALTRDRDTVHVHFTAEQATTRTLIQDAQPRLALLAEERGIRLGQTVADPANTGGAASQQSQQSQQQRQPQRDGTLPAAPRRSTDTHDDQDRADDGRLA